MSSPREFTRRVQRKVAIAAIGPSAVRGQGAGVQAACHDYLGSLPLARVAGRSERAYVG